MSLKVLNNPYLNFLGICRKAGKLVAGTEKCKALIKKNQVYLLIIANDISQKTEKEFVFLSKDEFKVIRTPYSLDELASYLGVKAGVFAVTDKNFAQEILLKGGSF